MCVSSRLNEIDTYNQNQKLVEYFLLVFTVLDWTLLFIKLCPVDDNRIKSNHDSTLYTN